MEKEEKPKIRKKREFRALYTVIFVILLLYVISMCFPMLWAVFTSLKTQAEFRKNVYGLPWGWPWQWQWSNYREVLGEIHGVVTVPGQGRYIIDLGGLLLNTLLYSVGGAIIQTIVPCVVAYLTAKFPYKFSIFINTLVVVLMATPIVGSQASEIQLLKSMGLYNQMWGNYIQKFNFLGMYYLVFFASFKSLPNDFLEAAYVDGASEFRVMWSVALPMVRNIIGTVFLLKFIQFWNDYETVLLYLPAWPTLANGVFNLDAGSQGIGATVPFKLAGCMFLVLPILAIFIAFKKKLMGNLSMGGLKE